VSEADDESPSLADAAAAVTKILDGVDGATARAAIHAAVDPYERQSLPARYRRLHALLVTHPGVLTAGAHPSLLDPAPARSTAKDAVRLVAELRRVGLSLAPLVRRCPAGHVLAHDHWTNPCRGGCPRCQEEAALSVVVEVLTGLLPGLGHETAAGALIASIEGFGAPGPHAARFRQLAAVLARSPELLTCGDQPMALASPTEAQAVADVVRLTAELAGRGRVEVVPLRRRCPAGHFQAGDWVPSRRCERCAYEAALGSATTAVLAALDGCGPVLAAEALRTVVPAGRMGPSRLAKIATYLNEHPDALGSDSGGAPADMARLIDELDRRGMAVAVPRCADCGRQRFLRHPIGDGRRVCQSCFTRRAPSAPCARCGHTARLQVQKASGEALCGRCGEADRAARQRCGRCGKRARISIRIGGVPVGSCCYLHPQERCSVCGVERAVRPWAAGAKATCAACAAEGHPPCQHCGLDAPVPAAGKAPRCLRCAEGASATCVDCGVLTVMTDRDGKPRCWRCYRRPERRCGRCGRLGPIARLATGEDPELCHSCWTGPITTCEGCGRLRPCRGERSAKMLCTRCRPSPKRACAYCGHRRSVTVVWADGPACSQCYQRFCRAKGDCPSCGAHRRLLPYQGFDQPLCAPCAGVPPGPVCESCGNEDWLYERGRCARCVLVARLETLLGDKANRCTRKLEPLFDALVAGERPESAIGWLRPDRPPARLLARIANGEIALDHGQLDVLADQSMAANNLQHLLTGLGVLPARDPELARLEHQLQAFLDTITDTERRRLLASYVRWQLLRRARAASRAGGCTPAQRHGATASLRAAHRLLEWIDQHNQSLTGLDQALLDDYLLAFPAERGRLGSFLGWARRQRLVRGVEIRWLDRPPQVVPVDQDHRWALARRLLHDDTLPTARRVATLLVVLFAQTPARIAALTLSSVTATADTVTIDLGRSPIEAPDPLAGLLRQHLASRTSLGRVKSDNAGPWLFPGRHPHKHAEVHTVQRWVHACGVTDIHAQRASALIDLTGQLPSPVVADFLGVSIGTAVKWSKLAGRPWGQYLELPEVGASSSE
jgi:hypothetical protein